MNSFLHLVLNSELNREDMVKPTFFIGRGSLNENETCLEKGKDYCLSFKCLKTHENQDSYIKNSIAKIDDFLNILRKKINQIHTLSAAASESSLSEKR